MGWANFSVRMTKQARDEGSDLVCENGPVHRYCGLAMAYHIPFTFHEG